MLEEKLIQADELGKIIGGFISYLQKSEFSGRKFNFKN